MFDPVGRRITEVRPMSRAELEGEAWEPTAYDCPVVLVLEDGTRLYPSRDAEGNGLGVLFGLGPDGRSLAVIPKR